MNRLENQVNIEARRTIMRLMLARANNNRVITALIKSSLMVYSASAIAQVTVPANSPATATPSAQPTPGSSVIGSVIIPFSPSIPQPNPSASENAGLPRRRGSLDLEPVRVYPFAGIAFGHNSNIVGSDVEKVSSGFLVLTTRLLAEARSGESRHTLSYDGNFGKYVSSPNDDFNDHEVTAQSVNQFTARADMSARLFYLNKSDPRGLLARTFSSVPDRWNAIGFDANFGYGAKAAKGRIEAFLSAADKDYQNNRDRTVLYDVRTSSVGGRFLYRVSPKTRLLSELQIRQFDYNSVAELDNKEVRALIGATWEAAASTTGTIKAGWMNKNFQAPGRSDFSGANFEAQIRWEPRSYSMVDLIASRSAVDSFGIGVYAVETSLGTVWSHSWRSYLSTRAILSYANNRFEGLPRTDNLILAKFGSFYNLTSWVKAGAEISFQKRTSDEEAVEFRRSVVMFTLGFTI